MRRCICCDALDLSSDRHPRSSGIESLLPFSRCMNDSENLNDVEDTIDDDVGCAGDDQLSRPGGSAFASAQRIVRQKSVRVPNDAVRQPVGCDRTVLCDEILDSIEIGKSRSRLGDLHQPGRYLCSTACTSASLARSPRSAAAIPTATLSKNRSCHSRECPCSSASATTCATERPDRAAMASTRTLRSGAIVTSAFIGQRMPWPQPVDKTSLVDETRKKSSIASASIPPPAPASRTPSRDRPCCRSVDSRPFRRRAESLHCPV